MVRLGSAAVAVFLASCAVSDPPQPNTNIFAPRQQPQAKGEQAEPDAIVAYVGGQQVLSAAYRYTGCFPTDNSGTCTNSDIDYSLNQSAVRVHLGASLVGTSYSTTRGATWTTNGKLRPNPNPDPGHGVPTALLWGDTSLAAGSSDPSHVALAFLAGSLERFDRVKDPDGTLHQWPAATSPDAVDAVCLAESFDGGKTYAAPECIVPNSTSNEGTDQPNVIMGAGDRIYVTVEDVGLPEVLRLYEVVGNPQQGHTWVEYSIDPQMADAMRSPRLRRDQAGDVWLAATTNTAPYTVRLCHVLPGSESSPGSCAFVGTVTNDVDVWAPLQGSSVNAANGGQVVRNGIGADFGVVRQSKCDQALPTHNCLFRWRFWFAYQRADAGQLHVHTSACQRDLWSGQGQGSTFSCAQVAGWQTNGLPGQHFQPRLEAVDRSVAQDGSGSDARYAFYRVDGPFDAPDFAYVWRTNLGGFPDLGSQALPVPQLPASPAPSSSQEQLPDFDRGSKVCPAHYIYQSRLYWGDYFAFRFVPARNANEAPLHIAVYSADYSGFGDPGQTGCVSPQPNFFQGDVLHLIAWPWFD